VTAGISGCTLAAHAPPVGGPATARIDPVPVPLEQPGKAVQVAPTIGFAHSTEQSLAEEICTSAVAPHWPVGVQWQVQLPASAEKPE
jgi:hypothetical protein